MTSCNVRFAAILTLIQLVIQCISPYANVFCHIVGLSRRNIVIMRCTIIQRVVLFTITMRNVRLINMRHLFDFSQSPFPDFLYFALRERFMPAQNIKSVRIVAGWDSAARAESSKRSDKDIQIQRSIVNMFNRLARKTIRNVYLSPFDERIPPYAASHY